MSVRGIFRVFSLGVFVLLVLAGLVGPSLARAQAHHVLVINVDGIINPVKERFISRAIDKAIEDQATFVVIELDTPGGLLDSTRKIVEELLEAPVPVAVYVSPCGARAGSGHLHHCGGPFRRHGPRHEHRGGHANLGYRRGLGRDPSQQGYQ